ncbi:MAG TPA: MaoC family dehydratase [Myxococcales bacterium]|nr:MaoC family dehydratase [Myxococcales bacterium]
MRYLEDFSEGQVFELGEETVSEAEVLEFARRYDAQPFHVDAEAAKKSMYGGLIASGWHTASIFMGLLVRGLLYEVASLGAGGIDEMKWLKPVRPGDRLRARLTILGRRPSTKHPGRGLLNCLGEMFNQDGERVLSIRWSAMIARRPGEAG